jgi:hypothetical protein
VVTLPNEHHYARYCKPTQIDGDQVLPEAFSLLEKDTDSGVSGDHFEYNDSDYRRILNSLSSRYKPSPKGYFAKLNCGEVINRASGVCEISFVKEYEKQSHTLMAGLTLGDDIIPSLLVTLIKEKICIGGIK